MEGQGEWARARQFDKKASAMWEHTEVRSREASTILSAVRREGLELIREGDPVAAGRKLAFTPGVYATCFDAVGTTSRLLPKHASLWQR